MLQFPKKYTDNRKRNTKRKITQDVFEECLTRDGGCVICGTTQDLDRPHHCYYGESAQYGPDRNNLDRLVTICRTHHHKLHFEGGNTYREYCKNYLKNIYD